MRVAMASARNWGKRGGGCQGGCRVDQTARGCVFDAVAAASAKPSRSGLSVTAPSCGLRPTTALGCAVRPGSKDGGEPAGWPAPARHGAVPALRSRSRWGGARSCTHMPSGVLNDRMAVAQRCAGGLPSAPSRTSAPAGPFGPIGPHLPTFPSELAGPAGPSRPIVPAALSSPSRPGEPGRRFRDLVAASRDTAGRGIAAGASNPAQPSKAAPG